MVAAGSGPAVCHRRTVRMETKEEFEMARVTNIHGQGRYQLGHAVGEVFVDFGGIGQARYVRFRVRASEDGETIRLEIDGEMRAHYNDAPALEIVVNGERIADSSREDFPQGEVMLP
jgi:hypothetical protein